MSYLNSKQKDNILEKKIQGKSNRRIARELELSTTTVNRYANQPFVIDFDQRQRERIKNLATQHMKGMITTHNNIEEIIEQLKNNIQEVKANPYEREYQQTILIYQKYLNTMINLRDKSLRTISLFMPSKQITIDTVRQKGYIQVDVDI